MGEDRSHGGADQALFGPQLIFQRVSARGEFLFKLHPAITSWAELRVRGTWRAGFSTFFKARCCSRSRLRRRAPFRDDALEIAKGLISVGPHHGKRRHGKGRRIFISFRRKNANFSRFHPEKCDSKSPLNISAAAQLTLYWRGGVCQRLAASWKYRATSVCYAASCAR